MKTLNIEIKTTESTCFDGCCFESNTVININGAEIVVLDDNSETILSKVLIHLGYKPTIKVEYETIQRD